MRLERTSTQQQQGVCGLREREGEKAVVGGEMSRGKLGSVW